MFYVFHLTFIRVNLSGGQKWRISFARALYSRAGILLLDDIFSSVDAQVGRQLFEDALIGELGIGRTRILVTHHLRLCLPRAKYLVILSEGTISHASLVEDLKGMYNLGQILKVETMDPKENRENSLKIDEENVNQGLLPKTFVILISFSLT